MQFTTNESESLRTVLRMIGREELMGNAQSMEFAWNFIEQHGGIAQVSDFVFPPHSNMIGGGW